MVRSRDVLRRAPHLLLTTLLLAWLTMAGAQERFNFLAINGALVDGVGPYYFVAQGDTGTGFVAAAAFAVAIDVEFQHDRANATVTFTAGARSATLDVTSDVASGLRRREGALRGDRGAIASPLAIAVDGTVYVPVAPLVAAFGGEVDWHAEARVITVNLPQPIGGLPLAPPRFGPNADYTRVAIDVAAGTPYEIRPRSDAIVILVPNASTTAQIERSFEDDPFIRSVAFTLIDGALALVITPRQPFDADAGSGFEVGRVDRGATVTAYVDVGPRLGAARATPAAAEASETPTGAAFPRRQVVVLDPGHGGRDPGAVAEWGKEKDVVLAVALLVRDRLRALGIEVIMTRSDDTFLSLEERSSFATIDRNLFVSIHANGAEHNGAHGIETFVFGQPLDRREISRAIQENGGGEVGAARTAEAERIAADLVGDILRETQRGYSRDLAVGVQARLVAATGAIDRGVKENLFFVIRRTRIPAILVELGFMTHAVEGRELMKPAYQRKLADALADGIIAFLDSGGAIADRR
jgi:N-acetylmuramoyl-L-alanine amidase